MVLVMDNQALDRAYYFSIKRKYLFWKTFLLICRFLFAFIFIFLVAFISYYSNAKEVSDSLKQAYETLSLICKIVLPVFILTWILVKIIVVLYIRKLKTIKKNVEIVDEI